MKWPAVLVLMAILLSAAIQPLGELANILKEKVVLNAALVNSCRAAQNNAVNIWYLMNLDAFVNPDDYMELFSDAFSESLGLAHDFDRRTNGDNRVITFTSAERFADITVEFEFENFGYDDDSLSYEIIGVSGFHDRRVTLVTVSMETPYHFRTFWLREANGITSDDYLLTDTRKFLVSVIN